MDIRIRKHAQVLINYSLELKKDEKLIINADVTCLTLAKEVYREALKVGAFPQLHISDSEVAEIFLNEANEKQLNFHHENEYLNVKEFDAFVTIIGTANTRTLSNVDTQKQKIRMVGSKEIMDIYQARMKAKELRWVGTMFPTQGYAQEANMSLSEFEEFIYAGCKLNSDDPITEWKKVETEQNKICEILNTKSKIRFISDETDISMSIKSRKWVNCCGKVNFPDGEVFTGPVEDSVEGVIKFSFPAIYNGKEVENVKLYFEKGKVIKATADKGLEFLEQMLDTDEGSRYVGEIAIGTNYGINRLIKHMLFDEKIGGTIHLALGRSIPESLGVNNSLIHWDMLCDMKNGGKIYADDELIYENGNFLIDL